MNTKIRKGRKNKHGFRRVLTLLLTVVMSASLMMPAALAADPPDETGGAGIVSMDDGETNGTSGDTSAVGEASAGDSGDPDPATSGDPADAGKDEDTEEPEGAQNQDNDNENEDEDEETTGDTETTLTGTDDTVPAEEDGNDQGDDTRDEAAAEANVIASFGEYESFMEIQGGTLEEIAAQLPSEIEATMSDETTTMIPARWECYGDFEEGAEYYEFDFVVPEGYSLSSNLFDWDLPQIIVKVTGQDISTAQSFEDSAFWEDFVNGNYTVEDFSVDQSLNTPEKRLEVAARYGLEGYLDADNYLTEKFFTRYTGEELTYIIQKDHEILYLFGLSSFSSSTGIQLFAVTESKVITSNHSETFGYTTNSFVITMADTGYEGEAFCSQHSLLAPAAGTTLYHGGEVTNENIRKILYYWGNGQAANYSSEVSPGWISLAVSYYVQGSVQTNSRFRGFLDWLESQPDAPSSFKAYWANTAGSGTQNLVYGMDAPDGSLEIYKSSANPSITDGNSCYSLEGAVYGLYADSGCTELVTTLTTDSNGYAQATGLGVGDYWVCEITAPAGYEADSAVYPVTVESSTATRLDVADQPANDPVGITLTKISSTETTYTPSLAGAQFTVRFYAGVTPDDALPDEATRTWVIETQAITNGTQTKYYCQLSDTYKVSGDDFYYSNITGNVILPLGALTVQETKAPEGYELEGGWLNTKSGESVSADGGVLRLDVTQDGITGGGYIQGGNEYTKSDNVLRGGVTVQKLDADTMSVTAQGGATLAGAKIEIISLNAQDVEIDGKIYSYGDVILTLTTNAQGVAKTSTSALPVGTYAAREASAPEGYQVNTTQAAFTISQKGVMESATISDKVQRGGIEVYKQDGDSASSVPQGNATLQGAVIEIVNNNSNAVVVNGVSYAKGEVVMSITTDASGYATTGNNVLPYGSYIVREKTAPAGYVVAGTTQSTVDVNANGVVVTSQPIVDNVIHGGVKIYKWDAETGSNTPSGGATLQGAVFEIVNRCNRTVYVQGVAYAPGEVVYTGQTDADGLFQTTADLLPFGAYEVREAENGQPTGYLHSGTLSQTFTIRQNGEIVDLTTGDNIQNQVIRGDLELTKVDADTQNAMANVTFRITSTTTGESHTFTTDANGYYNSSATWNKHTQDTNGGTAVSGLWFGDGDPDDSMGALPYDTYLVEELPSEGNAGYNLWSGTFTIYRENQLYQLYVEDTAIRISTSVVSDESGSKWEFAGDSVTLVDTVTMTGLTARESYTLVGMIMDKTTGEPLVNANGEPITNSLSFTSGNTGSAVREMRFNIDASALAGHDLVVFEYLYAGKNPANDDAPVAIHEDINDLDQTLHLPECHTSIADTETGANISYADDTVTLVDTVSYSNLQSGKNYVVTGTLYNQDTGKAAVDTDGNPITASAALRIPASYDDDGFIQSVSGTVDVTFTFDASLLAGTVLVCGEEITSSGYTWAVHADLSDEAQSDYVPSVSTQALDAASGTQNVMAGEAQVIVDTVTYQAMKPNMTYRVETTLVDTATGNAIVDADGNTVSAETELTPASANGTFKVDLALNASKLENVTAVVYQKIYCNGILIADEQDIDCAEQQIHFPKVRTNAVADATDDHISDNLDQVTITDSVSVWNLVVGQEYTITGVLYNQDTGEKLLDADGNEYTVSKTFTAKQTDDVIDIVFTIDASALEGETVVATETLYTNNIPVGIHFNLSDESQSVHIPKIRTVAMDSETKDHISLADNSVTITDTVSYENLLTDGHEYVFTGTLVVQSTGKVLTDADGSPVTVSQTVTPDTADGTVDLTFHIDASALAGEILTVYETVTLNGVQVGDHQERYDSSQMIYLPKITTEAIDAASATQNAFAGDGAQITDTVTYQSLQPGVTYTVISYLMNAETGVAILDASGVPVTVSTDLTPTSSDGSFDVTFEFDASELEDTKTVVYQEIYYKGVLVAEHKDADCFEQQIWFPEVQTTALTDTTNDHIADAGEVTITDSVTLSKLIVGQTYTINGELVNQDTGDKILDANGAPYTASKTFTATDENEVHELTFTVDASVLAGETIICFEDLFTNGVRVGSHADLSDESQSTHIPKIWTVALDSETEDHIALADGSVTITDKVGYKNLVCDGREYVFTAALMLQSSGLPLMDADGNPVTVTRTVTPTATFGTVEMEFVIDASALAGETVTVFETVTLNGVQVASETDLFSNNQSVAFPEIHTTLLDTDSGTHNTLGDETATVVDTVEYSNLLCDGREYEVIGTLVVKSTGEKLLDKEGNPITQSVTFVPETPDGSVELTFTFDASLLKGDAVVAFESIEYKGIEVGVHADLTDLDQHSFVPLLQTVALDSESGTHTAMADESVTIIDTISYSSVNVGDTFLIEGYLVNAATGETLLDADGNAISDSVTFTAQANEGAEKLTFTFNGTDLAGGSVVAFTRMYIQNDEGEYVVVAIHEDKSNLDETVSLPSVGTTAVEKQSGEHITLADKEVTIVDTVALKGLVVGDEYTLTAQLMNAETEEAITGATVTKTFTATAASMNVKMEFTLDASALSGVTTVVYEYLYTGVDNTLVGRHCDPEDESQQVKFPEIYTTALDSESGNHYSIADESVTIYDEVFYENLICDGREYTVFGTMMDKATGEVLLDANGEPVTASIAFVPEQPNASVILTFTFDGSLLAGETIVAFETLYYNGREIAVHEDLNDGGQTIYFPRITTTAWDSETLTHEGDADASVTIYDEVIYTNLEVGVQYTLIGWIMDKDTQDCVYDVMGNPVYYTATFTPDETNGSIIVSYTFDGTYVPDHTIVVFETLYRGTDITGQPVARHWDFDSVDQSVFLKNTDTPPTTFNPPTTPKTGDSAMAGTACVIALAAACALAAIWIFSRKRRKDADGAVKRSAV